MLMAVTTEEWDLKAEQSLVTQELRRERGKEKMGLKGLTVSGWCSGRNLDVFFQIKGSAALRLSCWWDLWIGWPAGCLFMEYICTAVPLVWMSELQSLWRGCQSYNADDSSAKDTHVVSAHSHFWRNTLVHHHRSVTIGLNIDVLVASERQKTRSQASSYFNEILR